MNSGHELQIKTRNRLQERVSERGVPIQAETRVGRNGCASSISLTSSGKYLCFLVTRVNESNTIDLEHVMLALTRLLDFMVERGVMEVSMPVYDPNRGKLSPRELYAILHVVFAETEVMVHLH